MQGARYLLQRPSGFYLRVAIPEDLRIVLGVRELTRALNSRNRREALSRCRRIGLGLRALFDDVRLMSKDPTNRLTPARFRAWVLDFLREELDRFDAQVPSLPSTDRKDWDTAAEAEAEALLGPGLDGRHPNANSDELARAVLAPRGLELDRLEPRIRSAVRHDAALARAHLFAMKAEAVELPQTYPLRGRLLRDWEARAAQEVRSQAAAPMQALSTEVMRQMQSLDIEAGRMKVSQLFARFLSAQASKFKDGPEEAERRRYGPTRDMLIQVIGDRAVETLTLADIRRFVEHVRQDGERKGLAPKTIAKPLDNLRAVLRWAKQQAILPDLTAPLGGLPKPKSSSYLAFTPEEQRLLFESDAYRHHLFDRPSKFWLPLLGIATGARAEELASLTLGQVIEEEGIPGLFLCPDGEKDGKNKFARRWVPLHPVLIEAGFLHFVQTLRAEGRHDLFPDITVGGSRDGKGRTVTRDFTQYRRSLGIGTDEGEGRSQKSFHSFRSTMVSALKRAVVDGTMRRALVGHAPEDVHDRVYGQADFPAAAKLEAISKAQFAFKVPRYLDRPQYRDARQRGMSSRMEIVPADGENS